jgi:PPOX class probable F420-dependent enzyme
MDLDEAREFIRGNRNGVLATTRADGKPQLSPVWAAVDDAGRVVISTREPAYKVRNLRRTPYASYCALSDEFLGRWLQVEGPVEIISGPEAVDGLVDYYRRLSGEHPDWDDYRATMLRDQRCLIALTITRAGPDVKG